MFPQLTRSCACCCQFILANFLISSAHLTFCLPLTRLPSLVIQLVTLNDQRLSFLQARCPAHVHFLFLISTIISLTTVCSLIHLDVLANNFLWLQRSVISIAITICEFCPEVQH
uniref:Uncharacterized protein n=1 Tax=Rhipicephalus microplus TaxID=6941 RepID=A0A6M2CI20_RHIMP